MWQRCTVFCVAVQQQEKGIPMGINPAVLMANYFIFYHECQFMQWLADIVEAHQPRFNEVAHARVFFDDRGDDPHPRWWVGESTVPLEHRGAAARYVAFLNEGTPAVLWTTTHQAPMVSCRIGGMTMRTFRAVLIQGCISPSPERQ